jgi:hypothetical protein|tara:strand:+ start:488 stop:727 length:240 start_codon:yes stop_codon:yes gene_type:complete
MENTVILTSEQHGCAYSIDSEGTLYYTPMFTDNKVDTQDWSEVDFMSLYGEEENLQQEINTIQEQLITMSKALGTYYTN